MTRVTGGNKKKANNKNLLEIFRTAPEEKSETQLQAEKERFFRRFEQEFRQPRAAEKLVFDQTSQEVKLQIAAIQEELKKLALSTRSLTKEVKIAAQQTPVDPGVYHLSFFEKLRQRLILLRKRVDESATWLNASNQRAKGRNYYWRQVKKSGTKFMLSQERYMATQAG